MVGIFAGTVLVLVLAFAAFVKYLYMPILKALISTNNPTAVAVAFPPKPHVQTEGEIRREEDARKLREWEDAYLRGVVSDDQVEEFTEEPSQV